MSTPRRTLPDWTRTNYAQTLNRVAGVPKGMGVLDAPPQRVELAGHVHREAVRSGVGTTTARAYLVRLIVNDLLRAGKEPTAPKTLSGPEDEWIRGRAANIAAGLRAEADALGLGSSTPNVR